MPEALRFTTFKQAFEALSATDKARVKSRAYRMAKEMGNGVDGEELFNAAIIRCLRQPFPSEVSAIAVLYQALHYTRLDFFEELSERTQLQTALDDLQKCAPVSCASPEDEIVAKEIVDNFLASLTIDARKIARGRILGLKGEQLRAWVGLDEARFKAAYRNYERNLLKIKGFPRKRLS